MTIPIIDKTCQFVEAKLAGDGSGHDWWHIYRVWSLAKNIAVQEGANLMVVELSALLHDIADWKFHDGDDSIGPKMAEQFLQENLVEREVIDPVIEIIASISYKGAGVPTPMKTLEGKVVQDADRLDAIGAMGIARTFAYGGHKNRLIYHPDEQPVMHQSFKITKKIKVTPSTIFTRNYFY